MGHAGSPECEGGERAGEVTVYRSIARGFTFLKPEQYQDLRGFYQKVAANDQQQLVLALGPEQKGN